jgi:hypothetical protein
MHSFAVPNVAEQKVSAHGQLQTAATAPQKLEMVYPTMHVLRLMPPRLLLPVRATSRTCSCATWLDAGLLTQEN